MRQLNWISRIILGVALTACTVLAVKPAFAQTTPAVAKAVKNPSPELVGMLSKNLSITPHQATGGAGALFGLAKSRLSAADFSKVASAVPGMGGLLKAAPAASSSSGLGSLGSVGSLGSLGSALPGGAGELASVFGSFKSLGLSPEMATRMVPLLTKYVEAKGGASVASILAGALGSTGTQAATGTQAPTIAGPAAQSPNPELVGMLAKNLSITPEQATGGAGALFGLAKSRLSAGDFSKVASAVPGMSGLLKAAPAASGGGSMLGSLESWLGIGSQQPGGLAPVSNAFKSLGLSPEVATRMVPLLTKYVEAKGGASVASILAGALK